MLVWISIISEASKKKQKIIKLKIGYLKKTARTTAKVAIQTLEFLEKEKYIRILTEEVRADGDAVGFQENISTTPTYERTLRTNDTNDTSESPITQDDVIQLFNDIVGDQGRVQRFPGYHLPPKALANFQETSGFPGFRKKEQWRALLQDQVLKSEFLLGKEKSFVITLQWLVEPDNAFKVLSGQYSGSPGSDGKLANLDSLDLQEHVS